MATAFTHALAAGALASRAPRSLRLRLVLLLAALAVLPDVDVLGFHLGVPYGHAFGHRGFTHSLLFAGLAGTLAAALFLRALGVGSRRWWAWTAALVLGTASHGLLDAMTDAGLGVGFLLPFDDRRCFLPWRPLATSPLGLRAFFGGPALAILASEALWVWLPVGLGLLVSRLARRARPASG